VRADSPYKTVKDLVDAIKAEPGKHKASGTGQGGIWHLALAGMLKDLKVDPAAAPWVPSNGAAPGPAGHGGRRRRHRALLDPRGALADRRRQGEEPGGHGRARPGLYPNLPTLKAQTGSDWTMAAWRGMAAPKGLPKDVETTLVTAIKKVYDSKEYKDFMASRGFGVTYLPPAEFAAFMEKSTNDLGATMKAVGIVK
jgi:tripartite-type tricarboxylate transporter receptor subunit TctC